MSTLVLEALIDSRTEADILGRIVDAMIDVQDELRDVADGEWDDVLRDACRREKWTSAEAL